MITYSFTNDYNATPQDKENAKEQWLSFLGKFANEFDEKNGFVSIDFSQPLDSKSYFSFNLPCPYDLSDFIKRFNAWQEVGRPI